MDTGEQYAINGKIMAAIPSFLLVNWFVDNLVFIRVSQTLKQLNKCNLRFIYAMHIDVAEILFAEDYFSKGNGEILRIECLVSQKQISDCFIEPSTCTSHNFDVGVRCLNISGE